ncbi:COG4315 family predicted lipoprotein [Streptomyces cavernicola]|uniref:Gram-positive cocci surface proteins LPxTG domain-containing protein n=1 Tax=Streptomyces cavernicola TaxID=3043613 RepID=A0ABT6SGW9_9ACTN|nr:hypothetical protein [Streptomyces sp. B-S-A6]MDI3407448.1 hypothetical protein [Streptomyces sp. B-S-A6]
MTGKSQGRISVVGALASTALLLAVAAPSALAVDKPTEPGELTLIDSAQGKVLADKDGYPLYLRDADKPDTPDCTGECAANWPAAIGYPTKAAGVTGETAQTEANVDGTDQPQVIYETHPLYYFKNDKPNEPKGQEVDGWSLIGPDGKAVKARGAASESPSPKKSPSGDASKSPSKSPSASPGTGDESGPASRPPYGGKSQGSDESSAEADKSADAALPPGSGESAGSGHSTHSTGAQEPGDTKESAGPKDSGGEKDSGGKRESGGTKESGAARPPGAASDGAAPKPTHTAPDAETENGTGTGTGTKSEAGERDHGRDHDGGRDHDHDGSDTGAMKATPSGAARGGAQHTVRNAAAEHPEAGPLALGSAAVAAGAGVLGIALLRRRHAQRTDRTEDGRN